MIHKLIGAFVIFLVTACLFALPIAVLYVWAIKAPIVFMLAIIIGTIVGLIFYKEAD